MVEVQDFRQQLRAISPETTTTAKLVGYFALTGIVLFWAMPKFIKAMNR